MPESNAPRHASWPVLGILAVTQVLSWGAIYYAFAVLAPSIIQSLRIPPTLVYGAFSWSLLVAGLAATPVGMLLDRFGGRPVMMAGSVLSAVGLACLGRADGAALLYLAWTLLGLAMAMTLYDAAFATLNRKFPLDARPLISTLTWFGGFASTLFWPLTWWAVDQTGWRGSCMLYAAVQLCVCLPLHGLLGRDAAPQRTDRGPQVRLGEALRERRFWLLAGAFSANTLTFSALSVHLLPLIERFGHTPQFAVGALALIGPMQVAGRVLERTCWSGWSPQRVGAITFAGLPAALGILLLFGSGVWTVSAFCLLYGISNGLLTIVRGTLPRELYGAAHYGAISGAMAGPGLLSKAAGPLLGAALAGVAGSASTLIGALLMASLCGAALYFAAVRRQSTVANAPVAAE